MTLGLEYSAEARAEVRDAIRWLAERNPDAAERFRLKLGETIGRMTRTPGQFPKVDDRHRVAIVPKSRYQVIFRVEGEVAVIVAVMHGSREPGYWRGRGE